MNSSQGCLLMPGYGNSTAGNSSYPPPGGPAIQLHDVSKSFGAIEAVTQVSFQVRGERIVGLVGSDGAGKSTLLRMIATMVAPTSGTIQIHGLDAAIQRNKVKPLIGYMPQRFGLYLDLTVGENINFFLDIFGVVGAEREKRTERYLGFSNLLPFIGRLAGALSGGMRQKLGLACVLVHEPKVLVLDEPTNGVDPVSREEFWDILGQMRQEGMTILISTAYLDEGEKCDRLVLMHKSRVLQIATAEELQSHYPSLEEAMIQRIQQADEGLVNDQFEF
jgi:ABC-2 type transport system ATP-binding protein